MAGHAEDATLAAALATGTANTDAAAMTHDDGVPDAEDAAASFPALDATANQWRNLAAKRNPVQQRSRGVGNLRHDRQAARTRQFERKEMKRPTKNAAKSQKST